jgi:Protein of unknown function (DUF1275)
MAAELSPKASVSADPEPEKPAAFTPRQSQSLLAALLVLTFYNGLLDQTRTCIRRQHDGQRCSLGIAAAEVSGLSVAALYRPLAALLSARQSAESSATPWRPSSRLRLILSAGIIEALLIFAAAVSAIRFDMRSSTPTHQLYAMIVLTALSMELRNATVRQLRVADITTTVPTLTLTGLVADSFVARGRLAASSPSSLCSWAHYLVLTCCAME